MKILGIDTSTMASSCALVEDGSLVGEVFYKQDMSHSENLIPMINTVLRATGNTIEDIDLFAVANGPGSYTGLRIGLATMKAFSHSLKKPIVSVSTLEALAFNGYGAEIIVPMIDARRDRVYAGVFKSGEDGLETVLEEEIYEVESLCDFLKPYSRVLFLGNGYSAYREVFDERLDNFYLASLASLDCRASSIAFLAEAYHRSGLSEDYFSLAPRYFRETQAQRELRKKER